jgi:hypothetical protein
MNFLYFSIFVAILSLLDPNPDSHLNADPDPATQINVDPDPKPGYKIL